MPITTRFLLCLLLLSVTACTTAAGELQTEGTLLVWYTWPSPDADLIEEIVDRYMVVHPNVNIVTEYVPSNEMVARYQDHAGASLGPDLLIGPELFLIRHLYESGQLAELTHYDVNTSELLAHAVDALRVDGALYGVPFSAYTNVLYYNKELVTDRPPQTLDDLVSEAQAGLRVAIPIDFYHGFWGVRTFDGTLLDEEGRVVLDQGYVAWLNWLTTVQTEPSIIFSNIYEDLFRSFASGSVAYFIGDSSDLPFLTEALGADNVGITTLPAGESPAGPFLELSTMTVSKNSDQKLLAVDLINFFTNTTHQRLIALSNFGQIPVNRRVTFDARIAPTTATLIRQSRQAVTLPLQVVYVADILRTVGTEIYLEVLSEVVTPAEGASRLGELVNQTDAAALTLSDGDFLFEQSDLYIEPEASLDLLLDLGRKLSVFGQRRSVQRQILAIGLIAVGVVFGNGLLWGVSYQRLHAGVESRRRRALRRTLRLLLLIVRHLTLPLLALLATQLAGRFMVARGWNAGILVKLRSVLLALLLFQLVVALFYAEFDEREVRRYYIRFFIPALVVLLLLQILGSLTDMRLLAQIVLAQFFSSSLTLGALFIATVGLYLWIVGTEGFQNFVAQLLAQHTGLDKGETQSTLLLLRYLLILLGFGYVFSQLELNSTTVAAITGGLSVGVGFGLREILSNFVSGVLLLFERSLHPGDVIEIDNQLSRVEKFSIRATTVRTLNNEELVIPNQFFFTSSFKTYTGTDNRVRTQVLVRTDCQIDMAEAMKLMRETAANHPDVLEEPSASVFVLEYGDNVASFQINVWVNQPMQISRIVSEIKTQLWQAFSEQNINLPFPEVELHFPKQVTVAPAAGSTLAAPAPAD